MCGIFGSIAGSGRRISDVSAYFEASDLIRHRGPDGEGYIYAYGDPGKLTVEVRFDRNVDAQPCSIVFGHRRLSIIDLSPDGLQPMGNASKNIYITYNGEIYNYIELRNELKSKGYSFKTGTDTEVLIAAYEEWGIDCLRHFNGMWAFAILDLNKKRVFASRDRFGVKPFYYTISEGGFHFASEIKAVLKLSGIAARLHTGATADYLIMALNDHKKETFFDGVYRLMPGEMLIYDLEGHCCDIRKYYEFEFNPSMGAVTEGQFREYVHVYQKVMHDSVRIRLRSDVPVGTCLSGGLDSSTIVALMNSIIREGDGPSSPSLRDKQHTFTACYENSPADEWRFASSIVERTNATSHRVFPTADRLWNELDNIIWHQEEPFGSTSIFAQWCVMELAKRCNITVLLDGQGADELMGGYHQYIPIMLYSYLNEGRVTQFVRQLSSLSANGYGNVLSWPRLLLKLVSCFDPLSLRRRTLKIRHPAANLFKRELWNRCDFDLADDNHIQKRLHESITGMGLGALLRIEDKNSMAHSREARTPFLDYRLAEMFAAMPGSCKYYKGWTKSVLRSAMNDLMPADVCWRVDKKGFETPEHVWMNENKEHVRSVVLDDSGLERFVDLDALKANFDNIISTETGAAFIWRIFCAEKWLGIYQVKP